MIDLALEGRSVLIAGAGRGIGAACARSFAAAGARVACLDSDPGRRTEIVEELERSGATAIPIACDVRRAGEVEHAVGRTVESFGTIDVCVDVIGEARWGRVLELSDQDWDDSFTLVLRHAFYLARVVGRQMVARGAGGAIVSITSVSGISSAPLHGAYGAAKAGLIALPAADGAAAEQQRHRLLAEQLRSRRRGHQQRRALQGTASVGPGNAWRRRSVTPHTQVSTTGRPGTSSRDRPPSAAGAG